ncbi:hypothetical protein [Aquabacterium sp.]|jgi:hypothetical protein|uniref:hypothetical protein n=1 Tax=Aquabacterium sp. TaxID=1872578 RepID=UPI0025C243B9|nr:hypothetical protein [Aquabacterium sp.]
MKHTTRLALIAALTACVATAPGSAMAMGMKNAPCDSLMDCVYTAVWYYFYR